MAAVSRYHTHCLVGAVLHLSREHCLPKAPAIALLPDAMPRPGLPLVHFNDRCCGSVGELRSIILTARRLADDHAEQKRAAAATKTWLLAQIEKKRAAPAAPTAETTPDGVMLRAMQRFGMVPGKDSRAIFGALLGHPPRSYRAFAEEAAASW